MMILMVKIIWFLLRHLHSWKIQLDHMRADTKTRNFNMILSQHLRCWAECLQMSTVADCSGWSRRPSVCLCVSLVVSSTGQRLSCPTTSNSVRTKRWSVTSTALKVASKNSPRFCSRKIRRWVLCERCSDSCQAKLSRSRKLSKVTATSDYAQCMMCRVIYEPRFDHRFSPSFFAPNILPSSLIPSMLTELYIS